MSGSIIKMSFAFADSVIPMKDMFTAVSFFIAVGVVISIL